MTVRLSLIPGGFSVLLSQTAWIDPARFAAPLAVAMGLPRSDTVRACRLQRGILFQGATESAANAAIRALADGAVAAICVPDSEVPVLPKALNVALVAVTPEGLATPSLKGAGLPQLWPWETLVLVGAGITIDPAQQAAGLVERVDHRTLDDASDRAAVSARQLERARSRVFPLAAELARPEPEELEAVRSALAGGVTQAWLVDGFGHPGTVVDLMFTRPLERLRITQRGRVQDLPRSASPIRNLHALVRGIEEQAPGASVTGTAIALASGADSGEYLFDDLSQFDDYLRWAWYWRLRRGT